MRGQLYQIYSAGRSPQLSCRMASVRIEDFRLTLVSPEEKAYAAALFMVAANGQLLRLLRSEP